MEPQRIFSMRRILLFFRRLRSCSASSPSTFSATRCGTISTLVHASGWEFKVRVGVISDTHGLLRPEALEAMRGVDHILHAGDVGDPEILEILARLAPVTAIRGNIDRSGACARLPEIELVELAGKSVYMLHDRNELDLDP